MKRKKILYVLGILVILCLLSCGKEEHREENLKLDLNEPTNVTEELRENGKFNVQENSNIKVEEIEQLSDVSAVVNGAVCKLGNLQGNLLNEGWICENNGKLYYRDYNNNSFLCELDLKSLDKRVLIEDVARAIQVVGDWVYYIDDNKNGELQGRIKKVRKDGSEVVVIGEDKAGYMLVTDEWIYYCSEDIMKIRLDGSGRTLVQEYEGDGEFAWLSIYGDCLFTEDVISGKKAYAIKLDGSGQYLLEENILFPVINGEKLWFQNNTGEMAEISFSTGKKRVWEGTHGMRSVRYKDVLYFHNIEGIFALSEDDGELKTIYPNESAHKHFIELFWVAADKIFFCDYLTEEDMTVTFQYIDLVTGEQGIVP